MLPSHRNHSIDLQRALASSKEFLDLQTTIGCGLTLKRVRGMIRTYSQMHRTDKIWLVWLNGWVSVYELTGCGFKSSCSHLNFRFRACFEPGFPWPSGNYIVWIHSEARTWHDKSIRAYTVSTLSDHYVLLLSVTYWSVNS